MGAYYGFKSQYGGDLLTLSIEQYVRKSDYDDFIVTMEEPGNRNYGTLLIDMDRIEYDQAVAALEGHHEKIMLVGVEDVEGGSPYIFVNGIERNGKRYMFPIIMNAALYKQATDEHYSGHEVCSYCLRLGKSLDPSQQCQIRIVHAPGRRIEWTKKEQEMVFASLN